MAKKKAPPPPPKRLSKKLLIITAVPIVVLLSILLGAYLFFLNRIYPGVSVGNVSLTGQTKEQSIMTLQQTITERAKNPLTFTYQNQSYSIDLTPLTQGTDLTDVVNAAWTYGHNQNYSAPTHLSFTPTTVKPLDTQIQMIAQEVSLPPLDSTLRVDQNQISVTPSQNGQGLDEEKLRDYIINYLNTGQTSPSNLPMATIQPKLPYQAALDIKETLDQIKLSPIKLTYKTPSPNDDDFSQDLDLPTIISLIDLDNSQSTLASGNFYGQGFSISEISVGQNKKSDIKLTLNQQKLDDYLKTLSTKINRPVQEPLLNFDQSANGGKGKITQFQPPEDGRELDVPAAAELISNHLLSSNLSEIQLPVKITQPKNQLVNNLGIKELLGEGVSHFRGSSADRIFNLELAASRVNGTLVAPGETFSFDDTVGDISAASGYHQGYVIEAGKTVLDDGGGVCQDPTTLFRAVLNAGLPVVARTAHAYRVGYYEEGFPPGIDATIYVPTVDFKFKNDTQAYILIQTHADNSTDTLYYDLYGTSDGRVSNITTPVILSSTPAPPDVHQDDPTQPIGKVTQIDFASSGARVVFHRTVTRNGQTLINESYTSNYQPQANVYLVGTKTN